MVGVENMIAVMNMDLAPAVCLDISVCFLIQGDLEAEIFILPFN